jgi:hypothetical protein
MPKPGNLLAIRCLTTFAALSSALACAPLRRGGLDPSAAEARLAAATKRWQGTRVQLAMPLEIRKDEGAWTSSGGIYVPEGEGARGEFYFRMLVDDRAALAAVFDGHVLRADTALLAEGWHLKDAESGRGPFLELRFADQSAKARVEFRGVRQFDFDDFPVERLEEVEEYCRQTLFAVGSADAAPAAAPPAAPRAAPPAATPLPPLPPPPAQPAAPSPARPAEQPTLQLQRVAVNPGRVPLGGDAELVAVYSVGGLTPGGAVDVLERREVLKAGVMILSTEDRYERPAATFTSAKPLRFSLDAAPGVYLLRVTLEAAGARVQGEASFEIR